jgi:hypothetical protein
MREWNKESRGKAKSWLWWRTAGLLLPSFGGGAEAAHCAAQAALHCTAASTGRSYWFEAIGPNPDAAETAKMDGSAPTAQSACVRVAGARGLAVKRQRHRAVASIAIPARSSDRGTLGLLTAFSGASPGGGNVWAGQDDETTVSEQMKSPLPMTLSTTAGQLAAPLPPINAPSSLNAFFLLPLMHLRSLMHLRFRVIHSAKDTFGAGQANPPDA